MKLMIATLTLTLVPVLAIVAQAKHYGPNDKVSCVGSIQAPDQEFAPLTELDSLGDLAKVFVGSPGRGGLCMARVYTVAPRGEGKLKMYRVWSTASGKQWGGWWTFDAPSGSEADYRKRHGLCPTSGTNNKLDKMVVCTLRVGAEFAVGPTQSRDCTVGGAVQRVPQSATNQVFMALGPATYSMWFDIKSCQVMATPW